MLDRIIKMKKIIDKKEVEDMTKKELIEFLDIVTDGFIEVYNDNITLAKTLHDLWTPLYEITFTATKAISMLKSCVSEE